MVNWHDQFSALAQRAVPSAIRSLERIPKAADTISFGAGAPDQDAFPTQELLALLSEIGDVEQFQSQALQYGPTKGAPALVSQIVEHLQRRGINCQPDNILVTNGSQQGLHLVCETLLNQGDVAGVDECSYPGALQVLSLVGAKLKLTSAASPSDGCKLIYTTPTFQNPTGATYTVAQRRKLLEKATELGAVIIEDDPYDVLRYDGQAVPPILSLDSEPHGIEHARTIYLGSFSKSIVPGMRIGWIVAPTALIERITLIKEAEDLQPSSMSQFLLAKLLKGNVSQFQSRAVEIYRQRRDALDAALQKHLGGLAAWAKPEGGFFFWLTLPEKVDSRDLLPIAAQLGVTFVPGAAFSYQEANLNNVRLSFSSASPERFEEGVIRLRKAIELCLK